MFGGITLGDTGDNNSKNEFFAFNIYTNEWRIIISKNKPKDRTEFSFTRIDQKAIIYGGGTAPSDSCYDDMWIFTNRIIEDKEIQRDISKEFWFQIDKPNNVS